MRSETNKRDKKRQADFLTAIGLGGLNILDDFTGKGQKKLHSEALKHASLPAMQEIGRLYGGVLGLFNNAVGGVPGERLAAIFGGPRPDLTKTTGGLRVGSQEAYEQIIRHQFGGTRAEQAEREKLETSKKLTTATETLAKSFDKLLNTGKMIGIVQSLGGGR